MNFNKVIVIVVIMLVVELIRVDGKVVVCVFDIEVLGRFIILVLLGVLVVVWNMVVVFMKNEFEFVFFKGFKDLVVIVCMVVLLEKFDVYDLIMLVVVFWV